MQNKAALKFAPVFSEDRKIDMSVENGETKISLSTWTEGLGWCTQKTMSLDAELLGELHRLVSAARLRVNHDVGADENDGSGRVLQFPKFA